MISEKQSTIESAIRSLNQALTLIQLAKEQTGKGSGAWELSLARINATQARHWLRDALSESHLEGV